MSAAAPVLNRDEFLARLATTAYQVALRHGIRGSFAELELDLWRELRAACADIEIGATGGPLPCPR